MAAVEAGAGVDTTAAEEVAEEATVAAEGEGASAVTVWEDWALTLTRSAGTFLSKYFDMFNVMPAEFFMTYYVCAVCNANHHDVHCESWHDQKINQQVHNALPL